MGCFKHTTQTRKKLMAVVGTTPPTLNLKTATTKEEKKLIF
jgi:hypothetical protein